MSADRRGVLDTNAVILLGRLDPSRLPHEPVITSITLAELSVGPLVTTDPYQQAIRQQRLQEAEDQFDVLDFDAAAAHAYGRIAAGLRARGRTAKARAFDLLIAAVSVAHDVPLHTCNPRDFEAVDGLRVVDVPHPDLA